MSWLHISLLNKIFFSINLIINLKITFIMYSLPIIILAPKKTHYHEKVTKQNSTSKHQKTLKQKNNYPPKHYEHDS